VRDAETDTLYGILDADISDLVQDGDNCSVVFKLNKTDRGKAVANKLRLGNFYKL